MNDKFTAEPCQLYIKQEIESRIAKGETAYQIDKDLRAEIKKYFEAEINPGTIEKRAQRVRTKIKSVRTDKVNSVRNDIPKYRMTEARCKLFQRAEIIGKEIGLDIEDTIHNALDMYTTL